MPIDATSSSTYSFQATEPPKNTEYQKTKVFYTDPNVCESVNESKNIINGNTILTCNGTKFSSLANKEVSVFNAAGELIKQKVIYKDGSTSTTTYKNGEVTGIQNKE